METLFGDAGTDTVVFAGNHSEFNVSSTNGAFIVTPMRGELGTDVLNNVEFVQYSDGTFASGEILNAASAVSKPLPNLTYSNGTQTIETADGGGHTPKRLHTDPSATLAIS